MAVGDYVQMTPTLASFQTDISKTGYSSSQTINPQELNLWRVLKKNSDGTIELISEYTSSTDVHFYGKTGYLNFVGYLNELASKYENDTYTIGSRYVGYNGQTEYITDTSKIDSAIVPWTLETVDNSNESQGGGDILCVVDYDLMESVLGTYVAQNVRTKETSSYWSASRYYGYNGSTNWGFYGRNINANGSQFNSQLYYYYDGSFYTVSSSNMLRPIIILKSDISYAPALGTENDPFVLK